MQGVVKGGPHPATFVSTMLRSSAIVGNRQSHWLLNPPACELPSELTQLPTPVAPPSSIVRKPVKAVPSGRPPLSHTKLESASTHHRYTSSTQCRQPLPATFFSHWSPVSLSVTVPSPLSTKRRVVVVVLVDVVVVVGAVVVVVDVVVVDVGVAHSPALPQNPLQHWWFAVQVARFGLQ